MAIDYVRGVDLWDEPAFGQALRNFKVQADSPLWRPEYANLIYGLPQGTTIDASGIDPYGKYHGLGVGNGTGWFGNAPTLSAYMNSLSSGVSTPLFSQMRKLYTPTGEEGGYFLPASLLQTEQYGGGDEFGYYAPDPNMMPANLGELLGQNAYVAEIGGRRGYVFPTWQNYLNAMGAIPSVGAEGTGGFGVTRQHTTVTRDGGLFGGGFLGDIFGGIGEFVNDLGPIGQIALTALSPMGAAIGNVAGKAISGQDIGLMDLARFGIPYALDYLPSFGGEASALPLDKVGALTGGGDMGWLSDLALQDYLDFGITGVESLGDALNYATGAADATYGISTATQAADFLRGLGMDTNTALNLVGSLTNAGVSPSNILKTILGGGGGTAATGGGMLGSLLGTGTKAIGGILQMQAAKEAAQATANAQIEAAKIAAEAAKFKPVGVTTRFGQSQFGYDDKGNLTSAGYALSPEAKAMQDRLMGMSSGLLSQYEGAQGATAPMGTAAQRAMALGQGYLGTDPAAQAAKYMAEQQALLTPYREREFADLENRLRQQGRLGLATGATSTGLGAANPELEAFYNAKRMQDLQLAAQATQGGMDYAKFGAGMVGTGGDLLKSMYGTQTAAYSPFQTALGGATGLEQLGQGAMDIGTSLGAKVSTANAGAGQALATGMVGAAQTQQAAASSPWAALLGSAGNMLSSMSKPQDPYGMLGFDPSKYTLVPKANL